MTDSVSDQCWRCGYDLRGIANDQPCPECGLLAERSRGLTDELHDTRPRWLRDISWGIWLILLAILAGFILPSIAWEIRMRLYQSAGRVLSPRVALALQLLPILPYLIAGLMLVVACLLLTSPERFANADRADFIRRVLLRVTGISFFLAFMITQLITAWVNWPGAWRYRPERLVDTLLRYTTIGMAVIAVGGAILFPVLLFYQLRSLARRARSEHLAEHCAIVGIGTSLSVAYIFGMSMLSAYSSKLGLGTNWMGRSNISLVLALIAAVGGLLFVLWSAYLMIRFAIAFGRASRQMKRNWRRDDRALRPGSVPA